MIVFLTAQIWQDIRNAVEGRKSIQIRLGRTTRFRIEWTQPTYHNPLDGETYIAKGGWTTYDPPASHRKFAMQAAQHVFLQDVIFLTKDRAVDCAPQELARYVCDITDVLRDVVPEDEEAEGRLMVVQICLPRREGGVGVKMGEGKGGLRTEEIREKVEGVVAPEVERPIKFQLFFGLWGYHDDGPKME
jgi:hypothetical protein